MERIMKCNISGCKWFNEDEPNNCKIFTNIYMCSKPTLREPETKEKEVKKKTVDFITAVNSGKRFRSSEVQRGNWIPSISDNLNRYWSLTAINAQFELEEKEITITEDQFDENMRIFRYSSAFNNVQKIHIDEILVNIKRKMGF